MSRYAPQVGSSAQQTSIDVIASTLEPVMPAVSRLSSPDGAMGVRESVPDFARTLSQFVDVVAIRTFRHSILEEFRAHASCPVINALSDASHPCQALADLMTVQEVYGDVRTARAEIRDYLCYYDTQRRHSSLSYLTPREFELSQQ